MGTARISQTVVEGIILPDSAKVQVSQIVVEAIISLQHNTVQVRETAPAAASAPAPTLNNTSWWPGSRVTIAGR